MTISSSPLGMPGVLEMRPWRCGGSEEGGKEGGADPGATKPVAATGGLWDELKASEKRMWYLCDVRTWRSHSQSRSMVG